MSSFSSGIGIASGLDIGSLIEQLLAANAQRRVPLQTRLSQIAQTRASLQQSQSLLLALRNSASSLALPSTLSATSITSSLPGVVSAIASAGAAHLGTTSLLVRSLASAARFVSSSLGSATAGLGASAFTLRFDSGRLDDDRALALLHGGAGVSRGQIRVTDGAGKQTTIDLRDALTINDVLRSVNEQTGVAVEARLRSDGRGIELIDLSGGGGTLTVQEWGGGSTAASLGILGSDIDGDGTITGSTIAALGAATPLWSLGGGVPIIDGESDFIIKVGGNEIAVDLGAGPGGAPPRAATLGEALTRINAALSAAGVADQISVQIAPSGDRLRITSSSAESVTFVPSGSSPNGGALNALGLPTTPLTPADAPGAPRVVEGRRLLFGMNDVGFDRLEGGAGLALAGALTITDRAGRVVSVTGLETVDSVQSLLARIYDATANVPGMKLSVGLDASGSRLRITDLAGGSGSLSVSGSAAEQLGLTTLPTAGGAIANLQSRDLRRANIGLGASLDQLLNGAGSGSFKITNGSGASALIAVQPGMTVNALARAVDDAGLSVALRVNALGDALEIVDVSGTPGPLTVTDESGGVAAALRLAGSSTIGHINGTRTVTLTLNGSESATEIAAMLNGLTGVDAELIDNGVDGAYLMISSSTTGRRNGVMIAVDGVDLGLSSVADARDARVLLNPTVGNGMLVTSETNLLTGLIPGVSLELKSVSADAVTVTVAQSLQPIKNGVAALVASLTAAISQLRSATAVDIDAGTRGALYGNATATRARDALRSIVGSSFGPDGLRLSSIGITLGADGAVAFDEAKLAAALESDPDAVRNLLAGEGGVAPRLDALLGALIEPSTGAFDGDDARLARIADNANSRIGQIDAAIERRRAILITRFTAMEAAIERLRWQQSSLQSVLSSMGAG